jgi:hypothetical protein
LWVNRIWRPPMHSCPAMRCRDVQNIIPSKCWTTWWPSHSGMNNQYVANYSNPIILVRALKKKYSQHLAWIQWCLLFVISGRNQILYCKHTLVLPMQQKPSYLVPTWEKLASSVFTMSDQY